MTNFHSLPPSYWETRYLNNETGWDVGEITTPLKTFFDQLTDKHIRILIPGAGNGYEAEYLFLNGFYNVTVIDLARQPLENIKNRVPGFSGEKLILGDFFTHDKKYDLIIEQTFFCALHPSQRENYARHMASLLAPGGKLVGLLFDTDFEGGPPFGGHLPEYQALFSKYFKISKLEPCYNSIKPRENRELFMILENK